MRQHLFVAACLAFVCAGRAPAQNEARDIVEKAIKAHGDAEKIAKNKHLRLKTKGTLEVGVSLPFTQEVATLGAEKFKDVMNLEVGGKTVAVTTVFDGKKAWLHVNDETKELTGKVLDEIKETVQVGQVMRLVFLRDKAVDLSPLGEIKIDGKPALGVKVVRKGHRDVDLFFDKKTSLLVKMVRRAVDPQSEQEVTEERMITEYQEIDGLKTAKKLVIHRDGKKFLELEVLEVKFPESIDDSEFAKP